MSIVGNVASSILLASIATGVALAVDNQMYSQSPPGVSVAEAPMFVCFGWDDNSYADGLNWIADYLSAKKNPGGVPVRNTFFCTADRAGDNILADQGPTEVLDGWKKLRNDGHEIANHSYNHPHGSGLAEADWTSQMTQCNTFLSGNLGLPTDSILGFRTPFLEYGAGTFSALSNNGFLYDCSVEFGFNGWTPGEGDPDYPSATSGVWYNSMTAPKTHQKLFWPNTLNNGIPPGHSAKVSDAAGQYPNIWEFMVYTLLKTDNSGVITGFDYNVFAQMDATSYLNLMKHNFDLRRTGNKCPLTINVHTDYYSDLNTEAVTAFPTSTVATRRKAIEDLIDYMISFPEVRVVPYSAVINWMRNPVPYSQVVDGGTSLRDLVAQAALPISASLNGSTLQITAVPAAGNYALSITALDGTTVFAQNTTMSTGRNAFEVPSSLAAGSYVVSLNGFGVTQHMPLCVSR